MKWSGLPEAEATWEHELTLWEHREKIQAYGSDEGVAKGENVTAASVAGSFVRGLP